MTPHGLGSATESAPPQCPPARCRGRRVLQEDVRGVGQPGGFQLFQGPETIESDVVERQILGTGVRVSQKVVLRNLGPLVARLARGTPMRPQLFSARA